jgi:hypothetical protein
MISNDVFEWELKNLNTKINAFQAQHKNPPEDLVMRKQEVETQLNLLQIKVRTYSLFLMVCRFKQDNWMKRRI